MDRFINPSLGVLAGGAVTFATQRGLDGRRERRSREREARADERAAKDAEPTNKAAAQLVFLDLLSILTFLRSSREVSRWWIAMRRAGGTWENNPAELLGQARDCEPVTRLSSVRYPDEDDFAASLAPEGRKSTDRLRELLSRRISC